MERKNRQWLDSSMEKPSVLKAAVSVCVMLCCFAHTWLYPGSLITPMTVNMTSSFEAVEVWIAEDSRKVIKAVRQVNERRRKEKKSRLIGTENSKSSRTENFLRQRARIHSVSDTASLIWEAEIKTGWEKNWSDFLIKCLSVWYHVLFTL